MLYIIAALLKNSNGEFRVQEIVDQSKNTEKPFSNSHATQMLTALFNKDIVFKNRHGRYTLAVSLLDEYIRRQMNEDTPNDH